MLFTDNMVIEASNATLTETADSQRKGTFQVRVLSSPAGEMRPEEAISVAYDDKQLQATIDQLDTRAMGHKELVEFGRQLASWLLPPKQAGADVGVRDLYTASLQQVGPDHGLRLCLRLPSQLAALPWEYMYIDPPGGGDGMYGFLALNRRVAIVRYEPLPVPQTPLLVTGTVKIVVALASPPDLPPLNLAQEKADLKEALSKQPNLEVEYLDQATSTDLQSHIHDAAVFHFAGHGIFVEKMGTQRGTYDGSGSLALTDTTIGEEQMGILLHGSLRLAVLGACESGRRGEVNTWSGVATLLVQGEIPAVVANQFSILDVCAIAFHQQFYEAALVGGLSIEEAVTCGRIAAYLKDPQGRDWGTAVLYLRSGDGHLFAGADDPAIRQKAQDSTRLWSDLLSRSQENIRHYLSTDRQKPGVFIPNLYVPRPDEEKVLGDFLSSAASALVVTGESGNGKTNLLLEWSLALQNMGHLVFFYDSILFSTPTVEAEVARDLSPDEPAKLFDVLEQISTSAAEKGKQCVLIFDAIGEFHGAGNTGGPDALVQEIIKFILHVPNRHIRVVLSCRTSTLQRLDHFIIDEIANQSFRPANTSEAYLRIGQFSSEMVAAAYPLYAQFFGLKTSLANLPPDLCDHLHYPLLLRMLALAYEDTFVSSEHLAITIYAKFYDGRVRLQDQPLVDKIAAFILRKRRSAFPENSLLQDPDVGPLLRPGDPDSSYHHLLDYGILTLVEGNKFSGNIVKFSSDQLGGYILTRYLLQQPDTNVTQMVQDLITSVQSFSLAWYTAQMLLIAQEDAETFASLTQEMNIELREVVVESIVEIHAADPEKALSIITQLLQKKGLEVQQTGLKAAYAVKPPAHDIFLWAAVQNSDQLRSLTRDSLYLIWRSNADFTYSLLRQLIESITINIGTLIAQEARQTLSNTVEFTFDLLATIYMNYCTEPSVIEQMDALFYKLAKKLPLDIINALGPGVKQLFIQWITHSFTAPMLNSITFVDIGPAQHFFALPAEQKAYLKQLAPFLDPRTDLTSQRALLTTMLSLDTMVFSYEVALAFTIHAYHDFATMKPFMRSLFKDVEGQGRLWLLLSLTALLPDTPVEWIELAEEFTQRLIEEHPQIFYRQQTSVLTLCDIALLPLGLAYGKKGNAMPYIESLLKQSDKGLVARCIEGLATVGFYYPKAVFQTLSAAIPNIATAGLDDALVKCLSTIRVVNFDDVDAFLRQAGASDALQHSVSTATDVVRVSQVIHLLGLHNNTAHFSLFYPRMRSVLSIDSFKMLADATSAEDYLSHYTQAFVDLAQQHDFHLLQLTLPD